MPSFRDEANSIAESLRDLKAHLTAFDEKQDSRFQNMPSFRDDANSISEALRGLDARLTSFDEKQDSRFQNMPSFRDEANSISEALQDLKAHLTAFDEKQDSRFQNVPSFRDEANSISEALRGLDARLTAFDEKQDSRFQNMPSFRDDANSISEALRGLDARLTAFDEKQDSRFQNMPSFRDEANSISEALQGLDARLTAFDEKQDSRFQNMPSFRDDATSIAEALQGLQDNLAAFDEKQDSRFQNMPSFGDDANSISEALRGLDARLTAFEEKQVSHIRRDRQKQAALDIIVSGLDSVRDLLQGGQSSSGDFGSLMDFAEVFILWTNQLKERDPHKQIMINKFVALLENFDLHILAFAGDAFDPEFHQACHVRSDDSQPDGTILEVVKPGFSSKAEILRFASVVVNRLQARPVVAEPESSSVSPSFRAADDNCSPVSALAPQSQEARPLNAQAIDHAPASEDSAISSEMAPNQAPFQQEEPKSESWPLPDAAKPLSSLVFSFPESRPDAYPSDPTAESAVHSSDAEDSEEALAEGSENNGADLDAPQGDCSPDLLQTENADDGKPAVRGRKTLRSIFRYFFSC
jgi:hypothetical protein